MIKIVKIRGASMRPTLSPGDYLILTKARSWSQSLRSGFVVVVDHPKFGVIVKRVKSINGDSLQLEGDGPESTDTAAMGDVPLALVKGRARFAITPKGVKRL